MSTKRAFDVACTLLGLVILSPLLLAVVLLVKLESPGPAIYRQVRVGKDEKKFELFKFRSMYVDADRQGGKITTAGDVRVTGLGRFLRKFKIDELPQLINVLRGDMSIVGPRPEVSEYVDLYPPEAKQKIFSVRPGITDNASILFRNEGDLLLSAEDPAEYYVNEILPQKISVYEEYADTHTLLGDIGIIFRTLSAVFFR
jgi:lipopolysaccharide/colanic/teichoic acid biosynthesis glycosyltransferase